MVGPFSLPKIVLDIHTIFCYDAFNKGESMFDEELIELVSSLVEICKGHTILIKDLKKRIEALEDEKNFT
jgi:predicted metal-binding protein